MLANNNKENGHPPVPIMTPILSRPSRPQIPLLTLTPILSSLSTGSTLSAGEAQRSASGFCKGRLELCGEIRVGVRHMIAARWKARMRRAGHRDERALK